MLRAAVYARYSSSGQRATSIEDQVAQCRAAAARFGCAVADTHVYSDPEVSGAVAERPSYQAMLEAAERRVFDAVVVEAQDRLWRDQAEMHKALKHLRHWGIKVFSVETGTDLTGGAGSIVAAVQGWQAEAFLDNLREKTRRGMMGQVERGLSSGGRPYGYRSQPVMDSTRKDSFGQLLVIGYRRVIDKAEAKVVRRVFKMYAAGYSSKAIAHRLNAERIPPPRPKRGRKAQGWTGTTISGSRKKGIGILNNSLYIGRFVWNKSQKLRDPDTGRRITRRRPRDEWKFADRPELRIVSDKLWDQVKIRQKEAARQTGNQRGGARNLRHLFSGLLRCGICGARYTMRDRRWMACSFNRNRGRHVCANGRVVRREELEQRLLAAVQNDILSPQSIVYLTRKVNEALAKAISRSQSARRGLVAELGKAEQELENLKQAVRLGKATIPLLEMLEEATEKVHRMRSHLATEPRTTARIQVLPVIVEKYARDLRATLGRDVDRARVMLSRFLGDITLKPAKDGLYAEVRGNFGVLLDGTGTANSVGAGRGI